MSNRDLSGQLTRRDLLRQFCGGLGGVALATLLTDSCQSDDSSYQPELNGGLHHHAKARRVIQLFMNGGVSQMDTFDYKPELIKRHGQQVDFGLKAAATSLPGPVMKCPFEWKQHGESGRWVSSVFPQMAKCVDDLAFLMAMSSKTNVHGPASYLQSTGFLAPGFPCAGAWVSYALGSLSDNLPTFVVLPDAKGLPYNNAGNFTAGFLPMAHQGVIIKPHSPTPIPHLQPPDFARFITPENETDSLALLRQFNLQHLIQHPGDSRLEARIASYELAAKMQLSASEVLDVSAETAATHEAYGIHQNNTRDFGRNCLIARRMLERGVRYVQVWNGMAGASNNWDNHKDILSELPFVAATADQPIAALIKDLKQRGLLQDTLVIWTTEFGRMPFTQGSTGRDHNGGTFVSWLAGAGVRPGSAFGESDEFSYRAAVDSSTCYDLHATMLHLLGVDHERLTIRHNGIDRRLTDVHGRIIQAILA